MADVGKPLAGKSEFAREEEARHRARVQQLDAVADQRDAYRRAWGAYYEDIERVARFYVPEGAKVLELGCSTGDLLAALKPSRGVGVDVSEKSLEIARKKHPHLEFRSGDAQALDLDETFDFVILSDVLGHVDDVWVVLRGLRRVMGPHSRLLLTNFNFLWEPVFELASTLRLKQPVPQQNWLSGEDLANLLTVNGFEVVTQGSANLVPMKVPLLAPLANRWLARAPGFRALSLAKYVLARPVWHARPPPEKLTCSIVVPTRNEKGNVADIFGRFPELGAGSELIIVDGNSDDGTVEEVAKFLPTRPGTKFIHQGDGKGKGDAVRKGFAAATGDVLFILDADLTVPPEDMEKFYLAIAEGYAEFVNGSRLVYPMEGDAMRTLNFLGNKFFATAFSWILGRRIKDTLCGTKVLRRTAYEKIAAGRHFFGDFDPFGDFDLLFGAAKQGLQIVEAPVRYRRRTYGDTKIDRFRHGFLLLRMTILAYRKFKTTV